MWPTHLFDSKGARLVGFFFVKSVCRCYGSIFLEGEEPRRGFKPEAFCFIFPGFCVCAPARAHVYKGCRTDQKTTDITISTAAMSKLLEAAFFSL